jgi:drug/metabolite transporter (DMT)-like permease
MNTQLRGTAEMTAAMVIIGTIGWFVVRADLPVVDVVFWRCAFGAVTLLLICLGLGLLRRDALSLKTLGLAALGGIAIVVNWLLLFAAFGHASISMATTVYNTQPFMLVGLGALLFGERITPTKLAWLGVAFIGMLLIIQSGSDVGSKGTNFLLGILMALAAAFFYAIASVIAKKLKGTPSPLIALIQVCVGTVVIAPFAHFQALPDGIATWGALITLGAVHTGLVYILLYAAIQKLPTHLTGALSFIYPVIAVAVDYAAFGQRLQPLQFIGAAAILLSAAGTTLGWPLWATKRLKPAA